DARTTSFDHDDFALGWIVSCLAFLIWACGFQGEADVASPAKEQRTRAISLAFAVPVLDGPDAYRAIVPRRRQPFAIGTPGDIEHPADMSLNDILRLSRADVVD